MSNRLKYENSPYLMQHADNPVEWYPWGSEALEKARLEDKPIFLSIGYAACHWCHVMAHESFEDAETAAQLNEHFVSIKVDREERPDLDGIYMSAVVALTGHGGWPMSVFLTPDGQPFYGGTYFPPRPRHGLPSFRDLLAAINRAWREDRQRLLESSHQITAHIAEVSALPESTSQSLDPKRLDEAAMRLGQAYDWQYGGWGQAPKFPQPMVIDFLLNRASRGDAFAGQIALHALDSMSLGGLYDVIGGGFARYSTDNEWLVPHFEKMLYDNAQLARVYLHAYLVAGADRYRRVCEETLDFIARELMERSSTGERLHSGIYSSLDADSEGVEGKYYLWSPDEIRQALIHSDDAEFILSAYGVTHDGNFEGRTVLQRRQDDEQLALAYSMSVEQVADRLKRLHHALLQIRQQRVPPGRDDKVLTAWNGLALVAFAEAARYLEREDYLEIARENAEFLLTELQPDGLLLRSWRTGSARHTAYVEDYAGLILALLVLYQSDPDPRWFHSARQLAGEMQSGYADPRGGFFDTRRDQSHLIFRPKDTQDNATPSGNALAALALLQLHRYTGNSEFYDRAHRILVLLEPTAERYPTAYGQWLLALDFASQPIQEVAILGDLNDQRTKDLIAEVWKSYRPYSLLATSYHPPKPGSPELLFDRPLLDGNVPTAYVCHNFACMMPVGLPQLLKIQLDQ